MKAMIPFILLSSIGGMIEAAPVLPTREQILFVSKKDGFFHLFVVRPNGTKLRQLTSQDAHHLYPCWSPDGRKIVCSVSRSNKQHLYVLNADGTGAVQLTTGPGQDRAAAWSPDGKKIAFTRMAPNTTRDIFLLDLTTKKVVNLTKSRAFDSDATWSPDSRQIAFASNRSRDGFRVYVMKADGTNVRGITKKGNTIGMVYPAWSPDGKHLVYSDRIDGGTELFISGADGLARKQLTRLGGYNSYAAWSPRGDTLFFQHHPGAGKDGALYQLDLKTGNAAVSRIDLTCPIVGGRPAEKPH